MDFVSDNLFNGRRIRALTIVDNSMECLDIFADLSIKGLDVVTVLERQRLFGGRCPKRIFVDNGPEFISKELDKWAYEQGVALDYSRLGQPTGDALIESFNGSFLDECQNTNWFLSLSNAKKKIEV
ncbi:putative transposase [Desulforhopalus singaporensis]|uniref:Putative transposase n=1 Tax=Desulforhopalus singaporensis TaxID=91360 RepID=A0A1H0R3A8_9BACT|nr:putative transposase [Desulforhopalus singaporensis]